MSQDLSNVAFFPGTPAACRHCEQCGRTLAAWKQPSGSHCDACGRALDTGTSMAVVCATCWTRPAVLEVEQRLPNSRTIWLPICATCIRSNSSALHHARAIHQFTGNQS